MSSFPLIHLSLAFIILSSSSLWVEANYIAKHQNFLQCLSNHFPNSYNISKVIYTPYHSSYSSILNFTLRNQRFSTPKTPKPLVIITPTYVSHIQAAVVCSKTHSLQIRIRSGGHDFEGLSYIAHLPFIIVDMIKLNSISVVVESETAWVESGATLGELYYKIAEKSRTLAFPAGLCPTVGIGGHFSGGGDGTLHRKYGLAADNVIDATLVDANGKFHDKESMGEDLFWAIRGGGGGSFGIVVSWKVKLVRVPTTVTVCLANRTSEDGATKLIHRWQYVAHNFDENLLLSIILSGGNSMKQQGKINPLALFLSLYLGKVDKVLSIINTTFPELGFSKKDCIETSWIESAAIFGFEFQRDASLESLLTKTDVWNGNVKVKSDFVKQTIPMAAIESLWERLKLEEVEMPQIAFVPFGGKMRQISESKIPFSYRAEYLYKIGYIMNWIAPNFDAKKRHLNWIQELYNYMTPFVSKSPRATYANYRDLDIGSNNKFGKTGYKKASIWALKYFGRKNFNRLVHVKTKVDPYNFFRHEQSIPSLSSK